MKKYEIKTVEQEQWQRVYYVYAKNENEAKDMILSKDCEALGGKRLTSIIEKIDITEVE